MTVSMIEIADAVKDELNAQAWTQSFLAERMNIVRLKAEEAERLHVTVTPQSRTSSAITRTQREYTIVVYVGIQTSLGGTQNEESDPLIALGEEIDAYFANGRRLGTYPAAACVQSAFGAGDDSPWMAVRDENELMIYKGVVQLTFVLVA